MPDRLNFEGAANVESADPEKVLTEKQRILEEKLKELDEIGDAKGQGIDEGVKEIVASVNLNGFNTSQSCEGHVVDGYGAPYVSIKAPNAPEAQYRDEKKIYEEVAERYGISYEDVKLAHNKGAWLEATALSRKNGETPEFIVWRKKNEELQERMKALVKEFYKNRKAGPKERLRVEKTKESASFRVYNGGKDFMPTDRMNEQQKNGLDERLTKYREEMQAFGKFLKDKFLENDH